MTLIAQLTVLAVFAGLAIYMAKSLPKRVILAINAFAAGVVLFLIVMTTSSVINRGSEMVNAGQTGAGFMGNAWIFLAAASAIIFGLPLVLIFVFGERRRSVIIAVAMGLLNLGLSITLGSDLASGLIPVAALSIVLLVGLFLMEGVSMGALLMKTHVNPMFVLSLGLIAGLPALAGFNNPWPGAIDWVVPFAYAASAGFMIFYLPFILGTSHAPNDIKWHFIGMIGGLFTSGLIISMLTMFVR
jgi:hypothetical protein